MTSFLVSRFSVDSTQRTYIQMIVLHYFLMFCINIIITALLLSLYMIILVWQYTLPVKMMFMWCDDDVSYSIYKLFVTSVFHVFWCVRGVRLHIKLISIKCFFLLLLMWLGKTLERSITRTDRTYFKLAILKSKFRFIILDCLV